MRRKHIVRDPFNKVSGVLVLDILHLLFNFLHRDLPAENGGNCEVSAVARIASGHHVLGIEHLLCKLRYCDSAVLLAATRRERSEAGQEKV